MQKRVPKSVPNEPLYGWVPRMVKGESVRKALVRSLHISPLFCVLSSLQEGDINPFTKDPHSKQYKTILEARKKLPVFAQMDEFLKIVSNGV